MMMFSIDRLGPWPRRLSAWLWALAWPVVGAALLLPVTNPSGSDLVVHFSLFFVLAVWPATFTRRPRALAQLALVTAGAAAALEATQGFLSYRSFALADLGANLFGVALGFGLALLALRALHQRATATPRRMAET